MHSLDGATWTAGTNSTSAAWRSMTHGGGRYVAVSQGTATMHSDDGITWTAGGNAPSSKTWHAVAYNGSRFAVLPYNGSGAAMYSDDSGLTWNSGTASGNIAWQSMAYGDDTFVAVAD